MMCARMFPSNTFLIISICFFSDADPPSLEIQPSTGLVLAQKGDAVVLTCVADEDPTRRITWEKKVSFLFENILHLFGGK